VRAEERLYYHRRATEYDDWYLDRGPFESVDRPGWEAETRLLEELLAALPARRVLDVACGTGFLTRRLPGDVVGLDQSDAMLAVARARLPSARFVHGDAFALPFSSGSFDIVFTAHFYGHLRLGERERFLAEARRVAGEVIVVDSALAGDAKPEEMQTRVLRDGSRFQVYKRHLTGEGLATELGGGKVLFAGSWYVAAAA
jgi:ubiquinone/menaquinone biosynthesis C-methylase UbiE